MQKYYASLKRLWRLFEPFHKNIYLQIGTVFAVQLLSIGTTVLNSHLINSLVVSHFLYAAIFFCSWVVVALVMDYLSFIQDMRQEKYLSQNIQQYLEEYSLKKILSLTVEQHVEDHSAIKIQTISKGEGSAENIISTIFTNILPTVLYTIIAVITLSWYSPFLGLLGVIVIVITFVWSYRFRIFHNPIVRINRDNWIDQNRTRVEAFTHLTLAKYFAQESFFIKKYLDKRSKTVAHHIYTRKLAVWHRFTRNSFLSVAEMGSLGIAAILFSKGIFPIGTLYLVFTVSARAYNNITSLSNALRDLPIYFLDVEKYLEVIDKTPSFNERGVKTVSLDGPIRFTNVSFSYPKSTSPVLHDVSFVINQHQITAIVGVSGGGKSTITKILLRAYEYSGSVTIGGTELRDIDANTLREHVGYVEQHVDLLDDTIKENILFGVTSYGRKLAENNLEHIASLSRIDQFYHRLGDKKFETVVGERGIKLSGGERQRVGIARSIIKNPDILIFDEATSSLDTENEKYVMEAINNVSRGKTTIIIAHRLSTVKGADKIIVMDKGTVVGEGTHIELMQNSSAYQNLIAHQLSN